MKNRARATFALVCAGIALTACARISDAHVDAAGAKPMTTSSVSPPVGSCTLSDSCDLGDVKALAFAATPDGFRAKPELTHTQRSADGVESMTTMTFDFTAGTVPSPTGTTTGVVTVVLITSPKPDTIQQNLDLTTGVGSNVKSVDSVAAIGKRPAARHDFRGTLPNGTGSVTSSLVTVQLSTTSVVRFIGEGAISDDLLRLANTMNAERDV
jgi:hypothetical protein